MKTQACNDSDSNWWEARMKAALEGLDKRHTAQLHARRLSCVNARLGSVRPHRLFQRLSQARARSRSTQRLSRSAYERLVQSTDATRFRADSAPRLCLIGRFFHLSQSRTIHCEDYPVVETAFLCNSGYDARFGGHRVYQPT
jgi:hypothetical protein